MIEKEIKTTHLKRIEEDLSSLEYSLSPDQLIRAAGNLGDSFKRFHTAMEVAGGEAALDPIKDGFKLILGSNFTDESKKLALEALASPILFIRGQRLSEDGVVELFRILAECNECLSINNSYTPLIVTKLASRVDISPEGIEKLSEITASVKNSKLKSEMIEVLGSIIGDSQEKYIAATKFLPQEIRDLFEAQRHATTDKMLDRTEIERFPKSVYQLLKFLQDNKPQDGRDAYFVIDLEEHVLGSSNIRIEAGSVCDFQSNIFPSTPLCYFDNIDGDGIRFYIIDRVEFARGAEPVPENATYPMIFTDGTGAQFIDYSISSYHSFKTEPLDLNVPVRSLLCRDITDQVTAGKDSEDKNEAEFYKRLIIASKLQDAGIISLTLKEN